VKPLISPTKLEISVSLKICDIIIPGSLDSGGAYCYENVHIKPPDLPVISKYYLYFARGS
jgi:hypothetical protein